MMKISNHLYKDRLFLVFIISLLLQSCSTSNIKKEQRASNVGVFYSYECTYNNSENKATCHVCKKDDQVIPYKYGRYVPGMGRGEVDVDYKVGGCLIGSCYPSWYCNRDRVDIVQ